MKEEILEEYLVRLNEIFDYENKKILKLSELVENYNFKLIDLTILLACIVNSSEFILTDQDKYEISKYMESGKVYTFPNVRIERCGVDDG